LGKHNTLASFFAGLNNTVTIDDVALSDWSVYSLDFTEDHLNNRSVLAALPWYALFKKSSIHFIYEY